MLGKGGEDDAAGGDAGSGDAERPTATAHEPARHRRIVREVADAGRAEGDRAGETEVEGRERVHPGDQEEAGGEDDRADDLHRTRAATVDDTPHAKRVTRRRELHHREPRRDVPPAAECRSERHQEDPPRIEHQARVDGVTDEGDEDDPPAVEDRRALPAHEGSPPCADEKASRATHRAASRRAVRPRHVAVG